MDVNDLRVLVTVVSLVLFVALVIYTWSRRRKADHEEAANLPFLEDEGQARVQERHIRGEKSE